MNRRTAAFTLAALLMAARVDAAELEARLDRQRIAPGETVNLLLELRGGTDAPDVGPLGTDFQILDVSRGTRTTVVNGRSDTSLDWQLRLAPLRAGTLEIPALHAGSAQSAPLVLEVTDRADPSSQIAQSVAPIRIETRVDDTAPYVQGQVLLTAELTLSGSVLDGALSEPVIEGAVVEPGADDRQYTTMLEGRTYTVVERQFAVFPQRSGELRIPPIVFDGRLRATSRPSRRDRFASSFGSSFLDLFGGDGHGASLLDALFGSAGHPVRTASAPLTLDVRPRPEAAAGSWWLPARHLELIEEWESDPPVFRVGEPVNRVIAIRATGLSGAQLPVLELPPIEGIKQYGEPPVDDTVTVGDEIVSVKLQQTALVPTRPGTWTLPAVELDWWDTAADAARTAVLPSRTVTVLPGSGDLAGAPAVATPPRGDAPEPRDDAEASPMRMESLWSLSAGLGALVLGTAVGIAHARRRRTSLPASQDLRRGPHPGLRWSEASLRRACRSGDAAAALASLRALARIRWPLAPPTGATGWGLRLDSPALEEAIDGLDRAVYSRARPEGQDGQGATTTWDGASLWRGYRDAASAHRGGPSRARPILPELYPA
jgi:hypothetical protein